MLNGAPFPSFCIYFVFLCAIIAILTDYSLEIDMKLLSFGEIIWDVYPDGCTLGGAPLNFAAHAALQGTEAYLASAVGTDALGERALGEIGKLGIRCDYVSTNALPTGECRVTLGEGGVPSYKILEGVAYDKIELSGIEKADFDAIAFGTLALREEHNRAALLRLLHSGSFREIYTDLNIREPYYSKDSIELCLSFATIAKISDEELPKVTKALFGEVLDPPRAAKTIKNRFPGIKLILISCGSDGAVCYDCKSSKSYRCAAVPTMVVSTVGAGDSFGATFLTKYMKTRDVEASMHLAAMVSAFVVSHMEAIPADTREFLERA